MNSRHTRRLLTLLFALMCFLPAFAQSTYKAQLRGTITDPSGAVIPGTKVTITETGTNTAQTDTANGRGAYTFTQLRPSNYTVKAEAPGFGSVEKLGVILTVDQQATLDITLRPAGSQQTVSVQAVPVLLDSASATLGTDVGTKYLVQMPLINRDFFGLAFLAGGVTEASGSGINNSYPSGTNFVSNGQRNATAEIRLDGELTSAPEQGEGGTSNVYYQPSVEALQEFKVQNNSFSAEYGNNGGTVVNVVMKEGTNKFHGSAWYFGQRSIFDARDFFNSGPKPDHSRDQYGFSLGGPLRKQKTFFFVDFERVAEQDPVNIVATVPTAAQRMGDFSQTMTYDPNGNPVLNQIFNPKNPSVDQDGNVTRPAFANNMILPGEIDKVGQAILNLYPAPNQPGDPVSGTNNFRDVIVSNSPGYQFDIKVDHNFTDKQHASARYSYLHASNSTPSIFFDDIFNDGTFSTTDVYNDGLEYTYARTANLLWTNRLGVDEVEQPSHSQTPNPTTIGFPSYLVQPSGIARMPSILTDDPWTPIFSQCCVDTKFAHTLLSYSSSLSWVKGQHSFTFGGEQRLFYNNFFQPNYPTGYFHFAQAVTSANPFDTANGIQGNSFASILLGYGDSGGINVQTAVADKSKETAFYIQDNWKVTPSLTLNLGLRYEWSTPYSERHNLSQFSDFTGDSGVAIPGYSGTLKGTTLFASGSRPSMQVDRNNLGPRVGFAYQVNPLTVVRGGAGIYFGMNVATNFQYPGTAFSSTPSAFFSKDGFITQYATLENPFPGGIEEPQGQTYGKLAEWGLPNMNNLDTGVARNAEIYQWNLGIEQVLGQGIVLGIDYSANRSTHLPWGGSNSTSNRNFIPSAIREQYTSDQLNSLVDNPFAPLFGGPGAIFNTPSSRYSDAQLPLLNLLRPYPQFDGPFTGLPLLAASSWYNSLQVRFQKRQNQYLSFEGNYTWSKNTDDSSVGFNSFVGYLDTGNPQELDNLRAEHSVSANDATNRFVAAVIAQLPFGRGRLIGGGMNRAVDAVLGGWQGSTSITFQTGQPIAIGLVNPRIADGNQRPNVICSSGLTNGISPHRAALDQIPYLNNNCFADPGDQQPGNAPRYFSNIRGDGVHNFDVSFSKNFALGEERQLEVHADFFNFTNTPRFAIPDTGYESPTFGIISSSANGSLPRHSQFGVRYQF